MMYGNAIERMVRAYIRADAQLGSMFTVLGGPNRPDFTGGVLGLNYEMTTAGQIAPHLSRPYD